MISLFVSFTLFDPMLSRCGRTRLATARRVIAVAGPLPDRFDGRVEALQHRYEHFIIRWALGHQRPVLFGAIGLFVANCSCSR